MGRPNGEVVAMDRRGRKRFGLLVALLVLASGCSQGIDWLRWREQPDPATGVTLFRPAHQVIKVGQVPELSLTVVIPESREKYAKRRRERRTPMAPGRSGRR